MKETIALLTLAILTVAGCKPTTPTKPTTTQPSGIIAQTANQQSGPAKLAGDFASINHQRAADEAGWGWRAEMANPLGRITQCGDKYDIALQSKKDDRHALVITILADGKEVFSWKGHCYSVFRILGDRLYYADFHYSSDGGNVVAVDLKTGKKLWTSPLKGLGGIIHSDYLNLMNLNVSDDVVTVWGNESMGRYVEFKSTATGETVGNKVFPEPPATQP
jgi:hypothetical protein